MNPQQQRAQKEARDLAAQFNQSHDLNLIQQMKELFKQAGLSLNKAGIPPEHIQLIKQHWNSTSVPV